jgi:cell division inhibitor SulA/protein ImuA
VEWNDWHARVWRGKVATVARAVIPTGFRELDRALPGGGWPLGALTEILVDGYGIGELGLLMPALEALTKDDPARPKKWVAWVAPPFVPYAPALQQRGVNIDRLLMIHPTSEGTRAGMPAVEQCREQLPRDARGRAIASGKSRLWAIEQAIRSGSSAGVLAWVAAADDVILRRLQLAAEEQGCWVLLFRPASTRSQRSPAALRIHLSQARVEILKCWGGRPGVVDVAGFAPDPPQVPSR